MSALVTLMRAARIAYAEKLARRDAERARLRAQTGADYYYGIQHSAHSGSGYWTRFINTGNKS